MIPRPPRSTLFPTRRSSDLGLSVLPGPVSFASSLAQARLLTSGERRSKPGPRRGCECCEQFAAHTRSEEYTSELQSLRHLVCRLLLEKKNKTTKTHTTTQQN